MGEAPFGALTGAPFRATLPAAWTEGAGRSTQASHLIVPGDDCQLTSEDEERGHSRMTEVVWTPSLVRQFWNFCAQSSLDDLSFSRANAPYIQFVLSPFLSKSCTYLDFGGGSGHFAAHMTAEGFIISVEEPAELRQGKVMAGVAASDAKRRVDGLFMIEVIEHVLDAELASTFATVRSRLAHDGLLFITTPNQERLADSLVVDPLHGHMFHRWQHVRSLDKGSLDHLLAEHGFEAIAMHEVEFGDRLFGSAHVGVGVKPEFADLFHRYETVQLGDGTGLVCVARRTDCPRDGDAARHPRLWDRAAPVMLPARVTVDLPPPQHFGPAPVASRPGGEELVLQPDTMRADDGNAWLVDLPRWPEGDTIERGETAPTWLYEDDIPLGPAHAAIDEIRTFGRGRFTHWYQQLYFSSSDNSAPTTNGRRYVLRLQGPPSSVAANQ